MTIFTLMLERITPPINHHITNFRQSDVSYDYFNVGLTNLFWDWKFLIKHNVLKVFNIVTTMFHSYQFLVTGDWFCIFIWIVHWYYAIDEL